MSNCCRIRWCRIREHPKAGTKRIRGGPRPYRTHSRAKPTRRNWTSPRSHQMPEKMTRSKVTIMASARLRLAQRTRPTKDYERIKGVKLKQTLICSKTAVRPKATRPMTKSAKKSVIPQMTRSRTLLRKTIKIKSWRRAIQDSNNIYSQKLRAWTIRMPIIQSIETHNNSQTVWMFKWKRNAVNRIISKFMSSCRKSLAQIRKNFRRWHWHCSWMRRKWKRRRACDWQKKVTSSTPPSRTRRVSD